MHSPSHGDHRRPSDKKKKKKTPKHPRGIAWLSHQPAAPALEHPGAVFTGSAVHVKARASREEEKKKSRSRSHASAATSRRTLALIREDPSENKVMKMEIGKSWRGMQAETQYFAKKISRLRSAADQISQVCRQASDGRLVFVLLMTLPCRQKAGADSRGDDRAGLAGADASVGPARRSADHGMRACSGR